MKLAMKNGWRRILFQQARIVGSASWDRYEAYKKGVLRVQRHWLKAAVVQIGL